MEVAVSEHGVYLLLPLVLDDFRQIPDRRAVVLRLIRIHAVLVCVVELVLEVLLVDAFLLQFPLLLLVSLLCRLIRCRGFRELRGRAESRHDGKRQGNLFLVLHRIISFAGYYSARRSPSILKEE